ncbi:hypothetical protein [Piscinibacter gummiphilus]|uniref:Uncharacterized protein n=1 Tax=Piscinibacter gummiphilus TaxID=946333 RepID=A0ABZ0D853_9BURK|nr:hypothetical protein [Piscinibacter gummiphilus]WOB11203.1 hypothetical protein RXV79_26585 [Piscinibacter gummiphilus]
MFENKALMEQSWLELPSLVDRYVDRIAPRIDLPSADLKEVVCRLLGAGGSEQLQSVCTHISAVYPFLIDAKLDAAQECEELTGLASALLEAWEMGDEQFEALAQVESVRATELPWRKWAEWAWISEHENKQDRSELDGASQYVNDFLGACRSWRREILTGYTLVREGAPIWERALSETANLLDFAVGSEETWNPLCGVVMSARGFETSLLDEVGPEQLHVDRLPNIPRFRSLLQRHNNVVERRDRGELVFQVQELLWAYKSVPPFLVDHGQTGPCLGELLSRLSEFAYVALEKGDVIGTDGVQLLRPSSTFYVKGDGELTAAQRCTGSRTSSISVVTAEEARTCGVRELEGWFAIRFG